MTDEAQLLGKIDGRTEAIAASLAALTEHMQAMAETQASHGARISAIESRSTAPWAIGGASMGGLGSMGAVAYVIAKAKGWLE